MFKETKNNEDGSFKETKENLVLLNISLFPIIKKSTPFDKTSITKHDVIFHCREKECKCSFYISKEDLKATIFLCPKGHNICSKCYELSHFPISCTMQKNWIETHFENRHAALSRNVTKINCPFCEKPIENSEVTKKREKCKECKKDFCYNCMKEWDCKFVNSTDIHHCIENTYKGKEKFQAEKKIKELKIFEEEYQKFIREKIKNEEELKKINDNIETKLDKIKKNDKEYINDFMWLQDGINEISNCLFLGKSFANSVSEEKKEKKILNILNEIEENFSFLEIFKKNNHSSFDHKLKVFKNFIENKDNIKIIQKLKVLIINLEESYKKI